MSLHSTCPSNVITEKINGTWYKLRIPNNINDTNISSSPPPLVICIHGIGSAHIDFDNLGIFLCANNYKVLSYDLIGRGNSDFPQEQDNSNSFNGAGHVNQLRKLITDLNFHSNQNYSLISHSMGGSIAALYAEQYSNEIASLTFLTPAGLMDLGPLAMVRSSPTCLKAIIKSILKRTQENAWREAFVDKKGKIANDYVMQMKDIYLNNPRHFDGFWQSAMQFPLSGIDATVKFLGSTSLPSHLMWGMRDITVPPNPNLQRWTKLLSHSSIISNNSNINGIQKTTEYEEFAHGFFIEDSLRVNADILSFLQMLTQIQTVNSNQ